MAVGGGGEEEVAYAVLRLCRKGTVEEVTQLLDATPSLVQVRGGVYRWTPLISAAYEGRADIVELLLSRGAVIDAGDRDGHTALQEAAMHGRGEVVALLLSKGADVTRKNALGMNALMRAAATGNLAIVRRLLRHIITMATSMEEEGGRVVDERNWRGETALWRACHQGHAEVVRALLVEAGADHHIADAGAPMQHHQCRTPRKVAEDMYFSKCVQVIQWFEDECERSYALHKARCVYDAQLMRRRFSQHQHHDPHRKYLLQLLPSACLRRRGVDNLPTVAVVAPEKEEEVVMMEEGEGGGGGMEEERPEEGGVPAEEEVMMVVAAEGGGGGGGNDTAAAAREEGEEEERHGMVEFVMEGMNDELYRELMDGLRLR